jgi:hypothetical protein
VHRRDHHVADLDVGREAAAQPDADDGGRIRRHALRKSSAIISPVSTTSTDGSAHFLATCWQARSHSGNPISVMRVGGMLRTLPRPCAGAFSWPAGALIALPSPRGRAVPCRHRRQRWRVFQLTRVPHCGCRAASTASPSQYSARSSQTASRSSVVLNPANVRHASARWRNAVRLNSAGSLDIAVNIHAKRRACTILILARHRWPLARSQSRQNPLEPIRRKRGGNRSEALIRFNGRVQWSY